MPIYPVHPRYSTLVSPAFPQPLVQAQAPDVFFGAGKEDEGKDQTLENGGEKSRKGIPKLAFIGAAMGALGVGTLCGSAAAGLTPDDTRTGLIQGAVTATANPGEITPQQFQQLYDLLDQESLFSLGWLLLALGTILQSAQGVRTGFDIKQPWMSASNALTCGLSTSMLFSRSLILRSALQISSALNAIAQSHNIENQKSPINRREFDMAPLCTALAKMARSGQRGDGETMGILGKEAQKQLAAMVGYMGDNARYALSPAVWREYVERAKNGGWKRPQGSLLAIASQAYLASTSLAMVPLAVQAAHGGLHPSVLPAFLSASGLVSLLASSAGQWSFFLRGRENSDDLDGPLVTHTIPLLVAGRAGTWNIPEEQMLPLSIAMVLDNTGALGWFLGGQLNAAKTRALNRYLDEVEAEVQEKSTKGEPIPTARDFLARLGMLEGSVPASGRERKVLAEIKKRGARDLKEILVVAGILQAVLGCTLDEVLGELREYAKNNAGQPLNVNEDALARDIDEIFNGLPGFDDGAEILPHPAYPLQTFFHKVKTEGVAGMRRELDLAERCELSRGPASALGTSRLTFIQSLDFSLPLAETLTRTIREYKVLDGPVGCTEKQVPGIAELRRMFETGLQAIDVWMAKYNRYIEQSADPGVMAYRKEQISSLIDAREQCQAFYESLKGRRDDRQAVQAMTRLNGIISAGPAPMQALLEDIRNQKSGPSLSYLDAIPITSHGKMLLQLQAIFANYRLLRERDIDLGAADTKTLRRIIEIGLQAMDAWVANLENIDPSDHLRINVQKELKGLTGERMEYRETFRTLFPSASMAKAMEREIPNPMGLRRNRAQAFRESQPPVPSPSPEILRMASDGSDELVTSLEKLVAEYGALEFGWVPRLATLESRVG